jgi:hypothetical protein
VESIWPRIDCSGGVNVESEPLEVGTTINGHLVMCGNDDKVRVYTQTWRLEREFGTDWDAAVEWAEEN